MPLPVRRGVGYRPANDNIRTGVAGLVDRERQTTGGPCAFCGESTGGTVGWLHLELCMHAIPFSGMSAIASSRV
jgi:hypothetical protein